MSERFGQDIVLLEKLAAGGMAEVYRAKQRGYGGFEKTVALKRILPNFATNEEFKQMFRMEANLSGNLQHPNIAQVFGNGESQGYLYLVMEFIDGRNVRQLLARCDKQKIKIPIPLSCFIVAEAARGLDYAHRFKDETTGEQLEIIHRDMSPQNIMLGYEGTVKIVDFGIAKAAARADTTRAGVLKGKFNYMSPEQATGKKLDRRTDIFALGIILFELVTQRRLFASDDDLRTLQMVKDCRVPRPSKYNPAVTPALDKIILKALAADRNERYATADDLHADIQHFMAQKYPRFLPRELSKFVRGIFKEDIAEDQKRREKMAAEAPAILHEVVLAPKAIVEKDKIEQDPEKTSTDDDEIKTMISEIESFETQDRMTALLAVDDIHQEKPLEETKTHAESKNFPEGATKVEGSLPESRLKKLDSSIRLEMPDKPPLRNTRTDVPQKKNYSFFLSKRSLLYLGAAAVVSFVMLGNKKEPETSNGADQEVVLDSSTPTGTETAQNDLPAPDSTSVGSEPVKPIDSSDSVALPENKKEEPLQRGLAGQDAGSGEDSPTPEITEQVDSSNNQPEPENEPEPKVSETVNFDDRLGPKGLLTIHSIPSATRIYINQKLWVGKDGEPMMTPLYRVPLPPGTYQIELLSTVYTNVKWQGSVQIKRDINTPLDVVLTEIRR